MSAALKFVSIVPIMHLRAAVFAHVRSPFLYFWLRILTAALNYYLGCSNNGWGRNTQPIGAKKPQQIRFFPLVNHLHIMTYFIDANALLWYDVKYWRVLFVFFVDGSSLMTLLWRVGLWSYVEQRGHHRQTLQVMELLCIAYRGWVRTLKRTMLYLFLTLYVVSLYLNLFMFLA